MNSNQMSCLQKLVNALQECEGDGVTFSYASLLINVEDEESHYLESLSSERLIKLLNFIDGRGVVTHKPKVYPPDNYSICSRTGGDHMWGGAHCRHCDMPWPDEYK